MTGRGSVVTGRGSVVTGRISGDRERGSVVTGREDQWCQGENQW